MSANGKHASQAIPLVAIVPQGATSPRFQVLAQWHTGTGIMTLPVQVGVRPLGPEMVLDLFIGLVNQGLFLQVIREEGKEPVLGPLPPMEIVFAIPEEKEPEAPANRIITDPGGG